MRHPQGKEVFRQEIFMQQFFYTVKDENGLHARPAGLLTQCAKACSSDIRIVKGEKSADAKRLFSVMALGVAVRDEIAFQIEGPDEEADCAKLKSFCEENF